jgi:rod shape-determining protein MreC
MLMLMPRDALYDVSEYFARLSNIQKENAQLKQLRLNQILAVQQGQQLLNENARLRRLLNASLTQPERSLMATILYDARDSFTRRIIIDQGMNHGVALGQPVIDDQGVVGQITRVFPMTAEVTLLTDKDFMIPVQVQRSGLRGVLYGKGQSAPLAMRVASGIDGAYPSGLTVARVRSTQHEAASTFLKIASEPTAQLDRYENVLVLLVEPQVAARPLEDDVDDTTKVKKINRHITRMTRIDEAGAP